MLIVVFTGKEVEQSDLNDDEIKWLALVSIGKVYILACFMILLFIYFFSNIFWTCTLFTLLNRELKELEEAKKNQEDLPMFQAPKKDGTFRERVRNLLYTNPEY